LSRPGENLRVRRTRVLLRAALVELIEERGFDRLTVGEIAERAMVSRAAFYRNYRDKYHLVEQIFDEAMEPLLGTVAGPATREPRERWVAFFEHVAEYDRFYGALLGRGGSPWFAARMRAALAGMTTAHLPDADAAETAGGLVPTVLGAMFVQSIAWWLEQGRSLTPREMAVRTGQLAGAVLAEANRWSDAQPH
jgi:AcrR family transcriptional regulator